MTKAAIVALADTETAGDLGRVVNALTTAKEFKEVDDDLAIVFDGAGTKWIPELAGTDHRNGGLFGEVRDKISGACAYCSKACSGSRSRISVPPPGGPLRANWIGASRGRDGGRVRLASGALRTRK
jgi:hypothetical protein